MTFVTGEIADATINEQVVAYMYTLFLRKKARQGLLHKIELKYSLLMDRQILKRIRETF